MSNKQAINLTSLNLIQSELMSTIDSAATHLETFISERDNDKVLEDCVESLQQIRGSLDLVQLHGACELAGEILDTANHIQIGQEKRLEEKLAALTKGFFVLSCYFEYSQQHEVGMPVLLVPYINDIRLVNGQPLMPESYFETDSTVYHLPQSEKPTLPAQENLPSMIRRFRHMFQVGLLGFVKETQVEQSLKMMQRASSKIWKLSKGSSSETLWWLASHALDACAQVSLAPGLSRKRLFGQLDKCFKALEKSGAEGFDEAPAKPLLIELAYYVAIADIQETEFQKIKQLFGFEHVGYTEEILQRESVSMTGPSANTVQSVAEVLRIELNTVKEIIEQPELGEGEDIYEDIISRVQKVKEILNVVGLTSASQTLIEPLEKLQACQGNNEELSHDNVLPLADAFLYVESVLSSLEKRNFSGEKLAEINRLTQTEMISASHLQDAQLVVIEQAETGLTSIKSALTSFADSSYDKAHLENISTTLDELRGGMIVLSLPRAAAIIASCSAFIEETLMATDEPAALEHMLETFADALICLEYYLDCMKVDKNVSADTLAVAEESLAALGYGVSA